MGTLFRLSLFLFSVSRLQLPPFRTFRILLLARSLSIIDKQPTKEGINASDARCYNRRLFIARNQRPSQPRRSKSLALSTEEGTYVEKRKYSQRHPYLFGNQSKNTHNSQRELN